MASEQAQPANTAATIAVFDSGVGGLSVLAALRRALPACTFIYIYDKAYFPYGLKSEATINQRVSELFGIINQRFAFDFAVIACSTASTVVLPTLRTQCAQPVIGVVPAIKPAALLSRTKVIGLLATHGTIHRAYTNELIAAHAPHCEVIKVGSDRLVQLAEAKLRGEAIDPHEIAKEVAPLVEREDLDTVVLGCTHFPHLLAELQHAFPRPITMVEPSEAIARRLIELMSAHSLSAATQPARSGDTFLVSGSLLPQTLIHRWGFAKQELLV